MRATPLLVAVLALLVWPPTLDAFVSQGPMTATQQILAASNKIVLGPGDREQKLDALKALLRDFLDTDALGRQSMGKNLEGKTPEQQARFFELFRDLFVRTYVQRLLLFDAPDFAYVEEEVDGDTAHIGTQIVTPRDRFAVDYDMRKTSSGWRATDIFIEDVSLAANFRAQFAKALSKSSFDELMDRLERKLRGKKKAGTPSG